MAENRSRFVLLCQQSLAFGLVAAIAAPAAGVMTLDIVAPPQDQQIVCITLETNVLFARRLAAHLKHCPRSALARQGGAWQRTEQFLRRHLPARQPPAAG